MTLVAHKISTSEALKAIKLIEDVTAKMDGVDAQLKTLDDILSGYTNDKIKFCHLQTKKIRFTLIDVVKKIESI